MGTSSQQDPIVHVGGADAGARYRRLFEAVHEGILIIEGWTGRILEANPAALGLLGCAADLVVGRRLWETVLFKDSGLAMSTYEKVRNEGTSHIHSLPIEAGGRRRDLEFDAEHCSADGDSLILCRVRDVTERRRAEEQSLEVQKMEAVGQLAGGAAHGYNNILTATLLELGLLLDDPTLPEGVKNLLRQLENEANRAADLTRQLLTFGRRQAMQRRPFDLNELLGRQVKTLHQVLGEKIGAEFTGGASPLWIDADSRMIEQVVTNLSLNARDAMMPGGGRMTVGTALIELGTGAVRENPEARPGLFARLSVTDTGKGMDPQTLRHSFEPFFTTKEAGKGIGLGLAVVHGIAKQHDGWVDAVSEMGRGSTFRVYLPALGRDYVPPPAEEVPGIPKGTETILVVEDEPTVREMVTLGLQLSGYRVIGVASGEEAMQIWAEHATEIDLLFTDMRMGGMSGIELYKRLRKQNRRLSVIISSGYSEEILGIESEAGPDVTFLPKPYGIRTLGVAVRSCLDRRCGIRRSLS